MSAQGPRSSQNGGERRERSADLVHDALREAILSGSLPQGEVLSQVQLADQFGVSRTPLREALRMLQVEGFVESLPNGRVRVARFSVNDLEQLYAARIVLESLAVRLGAPHLESDDLEQLNGYLNEMDRAAEARDVVAWNEPHRAFHRGLTAHAGERMLGIVDGLARSADPYRRLYVTQEPRAWWHTAAEHRAIFEACRRADSDAAGVEIARHYARTALTVVALIAPEHDPGSIRSAVSLVVHGLDSAEAASRITAATLDDLPDATAQPGGSTR